ncbi:MAG TPA: 2-oxoacid:acceptor oxidoreductase subunit alpha [Gemmatimonadaceae bacterium]|jgi:2-oxoglutarate ferredoxin oxidoreductase subunit alpha|nr:2-oxoacid:acceptor oxidoreductase subunit alpha [Gemmatimonadaceae bacterium]
MSEEPRTAHHAAHTATNDFAFKMATVNGTGSASANSLLMQAIFRMGIPVTGKNVFPSNIQGLPTWYEIRVSRDGYVSRPAHVDVVVALNPETYAKDVAAVRSGGYLVYDSSWPLNDAIRRSDITILGIPFGRLCVEAFEGDRERTLLRNIVYVGSLVALLSIDMEIVEGMLREKFAKKAKLLDANFRAIKLGYDYATSHFDCPLPFHLERMDATSDFVLLDGNSACALGAVYAGATVGAWYPITPSTSLMEAFKEYCERFRIDKTTGKRAYALIQAEDELAAAGMVIGAGWCGARSFTSTAGPGISLMSEFIGLAYYTEIPGVFFDIQRTGPSTGMPTRTQQGDLLSIAYLSHGDTKHIALFPANPEECFYFAVNAFDLAERFQTPVFVVSDLDIGMNDWMCHTLAWDDSYRPDRGKVLSADQLERIERFSRYLDVDGDGVAARSLPGVHPKGGYFTRGSGHTKHATYTEDAGEYQEVVDRLTRKLEAASYHAPAPALDLQPDRGDTEPIGIISVGGCHGAVGEAVTRMRSDGASVDYMRIRAFPFPPSVKAFIETHPTCHVVEQNRDGQLRTLLAIETGLARDSMISVLDYGGLPLTAERVLSACHPEGAERAKASSAPDSVADSVADEDSGGGIPRSDRDAAAVLRSADASLRTTSV